MASRLKRKSLKEMEREKRKKKEERDEKVERMLGWDREGAGYCGGR